MSIEKFDRGENPAKRPTLEIKLSPNERGFLQAEFTDESGSICSIRESSGVPLQESSVDEGLIYLGVKNDIEGKEGISMHLNREMVAALLPHLKRFIEKGDLGEEGKE